MPYQRHTKNKRLQVAAASGLAAAAVTFAMLAALWALFDSASRLQWLPSSHANAALLRECEQHRHTTARHACVERAVAGLAQRASDVAMAGSAPQTTRR